MATRGSSGLSFLLGVDKPCGLSSHDVVNRVRRLFNERRVGHMGTLDPAASGVLVVGVGPATRLDAWLSHDSKRYQARISFGVVTDTDDGEGEVLERRPLQPELLRLLEDPGFAQAILGGLIGVQMQLPPRYSAIKKDGICAYEAARRGERVDLEPRQVEVFEASLIAQGCDDTPYWEVDLLVSKGCYIRSIARDLGERLGCGAHLEALRRTSSGAVGLDACVSLDELADLKEQGSLRPPDLYDHGFVLDPIALLGCRFVQGDERLAGKARSGQRLSAKMALYELDSFGHALRSRRAPQGGELIAALSQDELWALYGFDEELPCWRSRCGFSIGVRRGHGN